MKSVASGSSARVKTFPMLMQHDVSKLVVLFTDDNEGVVVASGNTNYCIGYYTDAWEMSGFDTFYGSVTISND